MRYVDELAQASEIVPDKLYFSTIRRPDSLSGSPTARRAICFSIDSELVHEPFFADFGPLNLGHAYRFCEKTTAMLKEAGKDGKRVYYCCGAHPHQVANASVLIGMYQVLCMDRSATEAYKTVAHLQPFVPFRDPTCGVSTFHLTVLDCLRGTEKAKEVGFINFQDKSFDVAEYEYYEQVEHGDLNWIVPGKFLAFSGPSNKRTEYYGYRSLVPEDYVQYFKHKNVTGVVRLNKKMYEERKFTDNGVNHYHLQFPDGTCPPDSILKRFIALAEAEPGALAVHCKAGLGRTGVLICCYMMKHFGFTAEESLGYIRIVRPGSVIGPQQQYLRENQHRMWREGEVFRSRAAGSAGSQPGSPKTPMESREVPAGEIRTAPMKSLRTGTHATDVNSLSRRLAGVSVTRDVGSVRKITSSSYDRYGRSAGSTPNSANGAPRSRTSALSASTPSLSAHRDGSSGSASYHPPASASSVRHSMPVFGGYSSGGRGTSSQAPPMEAARSAASDTPLRGFHTTPSQPSKSSGVARVLAPNGQPRKVPAALAVTGRATSNSADARSHSFTSRLMSLRGRRE